MRLDKYTAVAAGGAEDDSLALSQKSKASELREKIYPTTSFLQIIFSFKPSSTL